MNRWRSGLMGEVSDDDYRQLIAVNRTGAFNGMRDAARRLRDGGRVISLSTSIIGAYLPAHAVYAAATAGVEAMTHVLAKKLGARAITVRGWRRAASSKPHRRNRCFPRSR